MTKRQKKYITSILGILFILYLLVLFYLLFFSTYRQSVYGDFRYNLIPFQSIYPSILRIDGFEWGMVTGNLFGNILAFVPFGFILPIINKGCRTIFIMTGSSFLLSLLIEIAQLLFRAGALDVDDLILNTAGGAVGFIFFVLVYKIYYKFNFKSQEKYSMIE